MKIVEAVKALLNPKPPYVFDDPLKSKILRAQMDVRAQLVDLEAEVKLLRRNDGGQT